jgi:phosphoribosylaminoimidazole-succinocarboxamide synthase
MEAGAQLAEGKTKIVYAHPHDGALAIMRHKDGITAGDGTRRNTIAGKGALSGRTTAAVFALLERNGIATHFVAAPAPDTMVVRRCTMLPLEVVTRRIATGSYPRRHPETPEGTRFDPPLIEFFLKDDARHDPQVTPAEIGATNIATPAEVEHMAELARRIFLVLERAWATHDVLLCDLKVEFGRPVGVRHAAPLLADVIDNDSWRIWPGGDKTRMLDKQVYRNMAVVTAEGLDEIRRRYETVAELTERWNKRDPEYR